MFLSNLLNTLKRCFVAILLLVSFASAFAATNQTATETLTLTVISQPSITTTTLPSPVVGVPYSTSLLVSGGVAPYTWSVGPGLPSGLLLNSAGVLAGTTALSACTSGTCVFSATFKVTDNASHAATATLTLNVLSPLVITTTSLAQEYVNLPYSVTLTVSGGVAPYTWSASTAGGQTGLPAGMTLSSTGVLSGTVTPTTCTSQTCAYTFTATVTDSSGLSTAVTIKGIRK